MSDFIIRPLDKKDEAWVAQVATTLWGSSRMVSRGKLWDMSKLPGFIAENEARPVGLLTYKKEGDEIELASLNALTPGKGIGTALLEELKKKAQEEGCKKIIVITTNDNTSALHFYQKRGFVISSIRVNEMENARKVKPEIPLTGEDDIPLRDEIELEMSI